MLLDQFRDKCENKYQEYIHFLTTAIMLMVVIKMVQVVMIQVIINSRLNDVTTDTRLAIDAWI